jgi:hypothetical protein
VLWLGTANQRYMSGTAVRRARRLLDKRYQPLRVSASGDGETSHPPSE